jgi:hypothetical protein
MVLYESRKNTLAETFGQNGCIVDKSWMTATLQDLNGEFKLYADDISFLFNDRTFCAKEAPATKTKVIIREYNGLSADVTVNSAIIGKTNTFIEIAAGDYTGTVSKQGYVSQDIAFVVKNGETNEYKYVTLVKVDETTQESEYQTPTAIGAVLTPTLRVLPGQPPTIKVGEYVWFGWEFQSVGDTKWVGTVGVKLVDEDGTEFKWIGDNTKKQTVNIGEIKTLWAYCLIPTNTIKANGNTKIYALLTKTG